MTLRAVFFDVDDTLLPTTEFARRARMAAIRGMREAGLDHPFDDLLRELEEVIAEFSSNYSHHFDKLLLRVPRPAYEGVNPALIVAAGVVAYHRTKHDELAAYPGARALLRRLAATDLVRGVITAGWEVKQAEKLIRLGVTPFLSRGAVFISDQIGISKPNPKLYLAACDAVGVAPSDAIYVGDNPLHDIVPAGEIGMTTVRVRRGKYASHPDAREPDFAIDDFDQLRCILIERFGVDLGEGPLVAPGAVDT